MDNIKILIVEDELLIARGIARDLQKIGYQIDKIVSSGKAALDYVEASLPDLIMMDIAIKGSINGIETASQIRAKHDIPVIYLTAYADEKTIEEAVTTGSYGYILKPYKLLEMEATIKMALNKHQEKAHIQGSLQEMAGLLGKYASEQKSIYEDSLTNLATPLMLRELFTHLLSAIKTPAQQENQNQSKINTKLIAFIYLNLDRFQRFVNYLGTDKSNFLIKSVAEILTANSNYFDYEAVPIRLQHNEFGVLIAGLERRQIASNFAQLILEKLKQPFQIEGNKFFLTASMGIAFYPFDNMTIDGLVEQARQAMLYAQKEGGNKYKLYTSAFKVINSVVHNELSLESDLHEAISRKELELYYQPKVELKTGKIVSAEALLRWNHPKLGLLLPKKIIPIATANNLMIPIGAWVIKQACYQSQKWNNAGVRNFNVGVNISAQQLKQSDFFHRLTRFIFESNFEPKYLELELTEQLLVENVQANIKLLQSIKKLGIKISLDDFGTGYSSLSYLHQFPFDSIKIDKSFLSRINDNSTNAVIIKSIIEMAHQLDLKVIAEGVENPKELNFLVRHHCDEVQGYIFSRPLPAKEFEKLLTRKKRFVIPNVSEEQVIK